MKGNCLFGTALAGFWVLAGGVAFGNGDAKDLGSYIDEPVVERETRPAPGMVTVGARANDDLADGFVDFLVPLWRPGNGLLYFNPRIWGNDAEEWAYSLGGGYRHLLPEQQVILGANAFYDRITSDRGFEYNQLGVGAEILTKWFDFRFNYYLPEDDINVIDKDYLGSDIEWDNPFAQGNAVFQDYREIERWRYLEEAALEGYYVEAGFLVPYLERYMELRLFGGYYHYESAIDKNFDGFKARAEARILPAVALDFEYVEDEEIHGGNWSGGIRVSVPFEIGNIFQGRNPFEGITDMFRPRQRDFKERMTEMVIRSPRKKTPERTREKESVKEGQVTLVQDAVFANNDDGAGPPDGTGENPFSTIQEAVDYAGSNGMSNVVVFGGPTIYYENVVIDGFSLNLMGGGCIIGNGGKTLSDHVILDASGGIGIQALNAEWAKVSGFQIDNASIGIFASGVNDFEAYCNIINSATDYGIQQLGGYRSYIHNNQLYGIGSANNGIDVRLSSTVGTPTNLSVMIADNFVDGGRNGIDVSLYSSTSGDVFDAIIAGNTLSNSYNNGIYVATSGQNLRATVQVLDNDIFEPGSDAIHIYHTDSGTAGTGAYTNIVSGNYATGSGVPGDGVDIGYFGDTASVFAQVIGNELIDIFGTGVEIDYYSYTSASAGPGDFTAYVAQNTITGGAPGSSTASYVNRGVAIMASGYDYSPDGGGLNTVVDVIGNNISDVRDDGIYVYNYTYSSGSGGAAGTFDANASWNTVSTSPVTEGTGIEIRHSGSGYGSQVVNVWVNNNTVNNTSSDNVAVDINLYNYDSNAGLGDVSVWANNNTLNMAPFGGDTALQIDVYGTSYGGGADLKVWMNDNTVVGGTGAGLDLYAYIIASGSGTAGSFYGQANRNTITLNPNESQTAIEMDYGNYSYAGFANVEAMINDNVIDVGSGDGINVDIYSSYFGSESSRGSMQLWVNNNRIDMSPTAGETNISGSLRGRHEGGVIDVDVWINNNVMTGNTDNAIDFDVVTVYSGSGTGRGTTDVWVQNNRATVYDSGIEIDLFHSDYRNPDGQDMNLWVQNNVVEGKGTGMGQLLDVDMYQYIYGTGSGSSVPTMSMWVQDNTVTRGSSGIEVDMFTSDYRVGTPGISRNIWASGNKVSQITGDAIYVSVGGSSSSGTTGPVDVQIYNNVVSAMDVDGTGTAFDINFYGASFDGSLAMYNNRVESWRSAGIDIYYQNYAISSAHDGGGSFTAMVYDNQLTANSASNGDGIRFYGSSVNYSSALGGPDVTLDILRNSVVGFEDSGVQVDFYTSNYGAGDTGSFTATIDNNTISGGTTFGDGDGIYVGVYGYNSGSGGGLDATMYARNNTITSFSDSGVQVYYSSYVGSGANGTFTATVSGNRISNVYDDGVGVYSHFDGESGVGTVSVLDNVIDANGSGIGSHAGVSVEAYDASGADFTATISGNDIEANTGYHGVYVYVYDIGVSSGPSITADDNKISTVLDGLHIAYSGSGTMAFAGNRNEVNSGVGAIDDGFHFRELSGGGEIAISGTDNTVTAGDLDVQADGNVTGSIYVNGMFLP